MNNSSRSTRGSLVGRLDEAQDLVMLLVESAPIVLFRWDLVTNEVTWSGNETTLNQTGIAPIGDGHAWLGRVHAEDRAGVRRALSRHLRGVTERFDVSHRLNLPNRGIRWVSTRAQVHRDATGHPTHLIGAMFDEHARRSAEDRAAWSANHDALTGLPNRSALVDYLDAALADRGPLSPGCGLLLVDLDRFRTINRALGPLVGDRLLCQAAELIRNLTGNLGYAARVTGDQFAVVVDAEDLDRSTLQDLAHNLVQGLAVPMAADEHDVVLGGSVGLLWLDHRWCESSGALRDAERALARAKAEGGGGWAPFQGTEDGHAERLSLEARLRNALRNKSFTLVYHPIVELPSRTIIAFEALIRLEDGNPFVSPAAFIPVAEESGLIVPLGDWILRQAISTLHRWKATEGGQHLSMNINLSAVQFGEPGLVERIDELLDTYPLARGSINLELTETALLAHPGRQAATLEALRDRGCQIHIDDFGTGYSSLSNLAQLPVDALKVDREFVMRAEEDPRSLAIVRMVARMAQEMGLSLTAEGIETEGQVQLLTAMGPCQGQGYLFAKPLTEADAIAQLSAPTTIIGRWKEAG